jgi:hypothetical protein
MNHPRTFLLMLVALVLLPGTSKAQHCSWAAGLDKIGLACDGSMEFSGMVLSCEQSPLHLWVSTDCSGEKTCSAALEIDGHRFRLGRATYVEDAYSGVTVPIENKKVVLERLAKARYLKTVIAGKRSLALTTQGLPEAITFLRSACLKTLGPEE